MSRARLEANPAGRCPTAPEQDIAVRPSPEHGRLIRKLESVAILSDDARRALAALPFRFKTFEENTDLVREGQRPTECCLIVEGMACRYKLLGAGQRQIMSLLLPGEVADLSGLRLAVMDHSVGALTPGRAAYLPHVALHEAMARHHNIAAAFWSDTLIDGAIFREWLAGVGRRTARQRIAHLICELSTRMRALDLIEDHIFELILTQAELGDALGLSTVHINRIFQELRREGLIISHGKTLVIRDWDRLRIAADFDPGYLHLR